MTNKWSNRNEWIGSNGGNSSVSFEEHNEHMREFCRSHADLTMVNAPRCDEAASLRSMRFLRVCCTMLGTGGSALLGDMTDRSALIPVLGVARYKLTQN